MTINMRTWAEDITGSRKRAAFPLMIFPALERKNITVAAMVRDAATQAECVSFLASRYPAAACVTAMDLSVEAEAFGSTVLYSDNEVPTVSGRIVPDGSAAKKLAVPEIGAGRTGIALEAAAVTLKSVTDRPVFGNVIGPVSLAGRLCDITTLIVKTRKDPGMIHLVLEKCTAFLVDYAMAMKERGVHGIVIAEPVAGLLSPALCDEFSSRYIARIVEAVQDETFMAVLHNCGNTVKLVPSMLSTGARALHFGNAVSMDLILPQLPGTVIAMGNVDPVGVIRMGSPGEVRASTLRLLESTEKWNNFVLSSGCDIPPGTPLASIDAFFKALREYNRSYHAAVQ